jgi:hypothetical protein
MLDTPGLRITHFNRTQFAGLEVRRIAILLHASFQQLRTKDIERV